MSKTTHSSKGDEVHTNKTSFSNESYDSKGTYFTDKPPSLLTKIIDASKEDNLSILSTRGKLKENYYFLFPINKGSSWEFVVLFDSSLLFEIEVDKDEEDNISTCFISLGKREKELLGINQEKILVDLDIPVKNLNYKQIEKLYHLNLDIFGNGLFTKLEEYCDVQEDFLVLKESMRLETHVTNGSIVNSPLRELYEEYCDLLKKFYYHKDVFYPISFAFYVTELLKEGIGYVFLLILNGLPGSGKSNFLKFMTNLMPCSYLVSSYTTKSLIRYMDLYNTTLFMDELDKVGSGETKKTLCGIINNSTDESGSYSIARGDEKKKEKQIQTFRTFGAKCIAANSLQDIEDSTISRSFLFTSIQNRKCEALKWEKVMRSNSMNPEVKKRFVDLAQSLFLYVFFNSKTLLSHISEVQMSQDLSSRDEDKLGLVKGVLSCILEKDELDEVITEIKKYSQVNESIQPHKIIITAIDYLLGESNRPGNYEVIEYRSINIVNELNKEKDETDPYKYSPNSPTIRQKLLEYGLIEEEYKKNGQYKTYVLHSEKLFEIIDMNKQLNELFGSDERIEICRERRKRRAGEMSEVDENEEVMKDIEVTDLS